MCFERKRNICIAKFGNLGANGVKGSKFVVKNVIFEIADPICLTAMELLSLYGATMMIKSSLLLSAPIVKHFQAKKPVQCVLGQNLTVLEDKVIK